MQVKGHTGQLSPHIMLEPHSILVGKRNHKNFFTSWPGLSLDLVHTHLTKKNQPYLSTSSNHRRASYQHKKRSCIHNQIQSTTSSNKSRSKKTPILSSSRQWIFLGKFIRTKHEGSQSNQSRAIRISWSLTIMTQTKSTLNPSRQDQAWI